MGVTTAIIGASCALGGALIGGGGVAYYKYRKEENERKKREEYLRSIKDLGLYGRRVRARISSSQY